MLVTAHDVHAIAAELLLTRDPSAIVEHHVEAAQRVFRRILAATITAIREAPASWWWMPRITDVLTRAELDGLTDSIASARLRGVALGADDSRVEFEGPESGIEAPDTFSRCLETLLLKKPSTKPKRRVVTHLDPIMPWVEVLEEFLDRGAVTRELWDVLEAEERRAAFTVAYQSSASFVAKIQEVVARGIADGLHSRDMIRQLRDAGESITAWHAETVYRNAVQSAYARGRAVHMTQPHVVAARPYWQNRAVGDQRTRPTHRAVNRWVMLASDPGWQATYPPYGHNCRCRVVARSAEWVAKSGVRVHSGALPRLPDRGWHTTPPPVVPFAA